MAKDDIYGILLNESWFCDNKVLLLYLFIKLVYFKLFAY